MTLVDIAELPRVLVPQLSPAKLITMTGRFKAALSGAGVAQWISMYAQTDTRASRSLWFGGTPWQKNAPFDAWGELRHLLFKASTELEWFEKYAMGRTYVWEKIP